MFRNTVPRYEILSEDTMAVLDGGRQRMVGEIGVEFLSEGALGLFRPARQKVEERYVRVDQDVVLEQVAGAQRSFDVQARNPPHTVHLGNVRMVVGSVHDPPFVSLINCNSPLRWGAVRVLRGEPAGGAHTVPAHGCPVSGVHSCRPRAADRRGPHRYIAVPSDQARRARDLRVVPAEHRHRHSGIGHRTVPHGADRAAIRTAHAFRQRTRVEPGGRRAGGVREPRAGWRVGSPRRTRSTCATSGCWRSTMPPTTTCATAVTSSGPRTPRNAFAPASPSPARRTTGPRTWRGRRRPSTKSLHSTMRCGAAGNWVTDGVGRRCGSGAFLRTDRTGVPVVQAGGVT